VSQRSRDILSKSRVPKCHANLGIGNPASASPQLGSDSESSVLTDGVSKQANQSFATTSLTGDSVNDKTKDNLVELTTEEQNLLDALLPVHNPDMEEDYTVKSKLHGVLVLANAMDVDLVDLLKYNRLHKKGALYIRSLNQLDAALCGSERGDYTLVNEYIEHTPNVCKECKAAPSDKRPAGHAQMQALLEDKRKAEKKRKEIEEKREYVRVNTGLWDYSTPDKALFEAFRKLIAKGKTEHGLDRWAPNGWTLQKAVQGDDWIHHVAVVRYMVNRDKYFAFDIYENGVEASKEYTRASDQVESYDREHAQGATA